MARFGNVGKTVLTFKAGSLAKTTTAQWCIGAITANNTVNIATGAADYVVGVIESRQSSGSDYVDVCVLGMSKLKAQASTTGGIAVGLWVICGTSLGTGIVYATHTTAQRPVGIALETPATGGTFEILVLPNLHGVKS